MSVLESAIIAPAIEMRDNLRKHKASKPVVRYARDILISQAPESPGSDA